MQFWWKTHFNLFLCILLAIQLDKETFFLLCEEYQKNLLVHHTLSLWKLWRMTIGLVGCVSCQEELSLQKKKRSTSIVSELKSIQVPSIRNFSLKVFCLLFETHCREDERKSGVMLWITICFHCALLYKKALQCGQ